jgi:ACS family tartrate transporter-like MFS transporter
MTTTAFNEAKLMNKLRWKIVPYLFLLFMIAMLDRMNIGFAALEMNKALGISASAFGMIAGLFFVAYFFFEVPSNILMYKFGARIWITRILISWGAVTVITGFADSVLHLAILRCMLGIAEAGFYPCIILYLTYWFPGKHLARTISMFMCAIVTANIITGHISTWIVDNVNWFNISGWRWLFILEGIPAILCGLMTSFIMTDRPENANFLTEEEKNWLISTIKKDNEQKTANFSVSKWEVLKQLRVWHLAGCYFCYNTAQYGLSLWMPQIIKSLSKVLTNTQVGLISTLPFICAGAACIRY